MMDMDEIIFLGNIMPTRTRDNPNQGRVYDPHGIAPCLNTVGGGEFGTNDPIKSKHKQRL